MNGLTGWLFFIFRGIYLYPPTIVRALSKPRARNDVPHEGSDGDAPYRGQEDDPKCPIKREVSLRVGLMQEEERHGKRPHHLEHCDVAAGRGDHPSEMG